MTSYFIIVHRPTEGWDDYIKLIIAN